MGVIDKDAVPIRTGSSYPAPFDADVAGRTSQALGRAGGLTQFGANLVTLQPGAMSSQRHWHANEDEFVMVTEGELVLVQDAGETVMGPGDCAAFPAGVPDGHHLLNRTDAEARFLVIGTRAPREVATYSDIDMRVEVEDGRMTFTRKNGTPYPAKGD